MTPQDFRGAVNTLVADWAAAYADPALAANTVPVFYENGPEPDPNTLRFWVEVELRFYGSSLSSVGAGGGRYTGAISTAVYVKEGEGTMLPDTLLGEMTALLRHRRIGTAYTKYPSRTIPPSPALFGWYRSGLLTPFVLEERV